MNLYSIISSSLKKNFPDTKVYKERAEKIERPAFCVKLINGQEHELINGIKRNFNFVVNYFPLEGDLTQNKLLSDIAEKLYIVLSDMEYDNDFAKGYDKKYKIEDNVLIFFVSFTIKGIIVEDTDKMETLEIVFYEKEVED